MLSRLLNFFSLSDPDDQAGRVVIIGAFDRIHADLTDPDGVRAVQRAVFERGGQTFVVDGANITEQADGSWRATIMQSSSGDYTVVFYYTDGRGTGKTATGTVTI